MSDSLHPSDQSLVYRNALSEKYVQQYEIGYLVFVLIAVLSAIIWVLYAHDVQIKSIDRRLQKLEQTHPPN